MAFRLDPLIETEMYQSRKAYDANFDLIVASVKGSAEHLQLLRIEKALNAKRQALNKLRRDYMTLKRQAFREFLEAEVEGKG